MEKVYSVLVALVTWTRSSLKKARLAQEIEDIQQPCDGMIKEV